MACSLIRSVRVDEDDPQRPHVPGRIVTTLPKAKELRPFVEKLVTMARKAIAHQEKANELASSADRNSAEWKTWRESEEWSRWNQAIAPAVAMRRRAFALLRDRQAVDVLFDELAERFEDRPGGYTRILRLAKVRLGDAGQQALIEFVGERDRVKQKRRVAPVVSDDEEADDGSSTADEEEATTSDESGESAEIESTESDSAETSTEDDDKPDAEE